MKAAGNVPLFLIGGINSPTSHSTMVGLYSAGGPVSASKAMIGVRTTTSPTYSSSPTVSSSDMSMLVRPTSLYNLSADSIYGYYTASHYRPSGVSGNHLSLRFTQKSKVPDHDTGSLWFDPGLRGGGASSYAVGTYPDYSATPQYFSNHEGISDDATIEKTKQTGSAVYPDIAGGWIYGAMPRHADQFFIIGNIDAGYNKLANVPNRMPIVDADNLKGVFYTNRWGTPASYFVCGLNNYFSTQTYEPLYSTLRGLHAGIEPWSINKGGPQEYHCTMWIRPVSGTEESTVLRAMSTGVLSAQTFKSRTTPCFATGYGGGAGMSFNIENDFLPDWAGLQEWSQLKIDGTAVSSYTDPVNVWITKDGLAAIADAISTESDTGLVYNLTNKLHTNNTSSSELNDSYYNSAQQTPAHENQAVYNSFRENLDPAQIWYYGRSIEGNSTVFADTLSQYFTTTPTSSSDMLFWGLSSGGSHLTLRHEDRIVHRSPTIIEPEQWHNVGFYVAPLTGYDNKNTRSGIFINGSLNSLKDYYIDTTAEQAVIFTPGGDSTTSVYNTPSRIIARNLGPFTANRTRGGSYTCTGSQYQTYDLPWSDTGAVLQSDGMSWVGPLLNLWYRGTDSNGVQKWTLVLFGSGTCEIHTDLGSSGTAGDTNFKKETDNKIVFFGVHAGWSSRATHVLDGELELHFGPGGKKTTQVSTNPALATDDYSVGTGVATIGQSIVSNLNPRQVSVLADTVSNITDGTELVFEPSWLLYELEKNPDDYKHLYYIEHPDGYGERLSLKAKDTVSIGKQVTLISSSRTLTIPSTDPKLTNTIQVFGDTHHSTDQKKFGTTSIYFDGTGDYLQVDDDPVLDIGDSEFTIEAWIYITAWRATGPTDTAGNRWSGIISKKGSPGGSDGGGDYDGWVLAYNQHGKLAFNNIDPDWETTNDPIRGTSSSGTLSGVLKLNTWHHVCVHQQNTTGHGGTITHNTRAFVDGENNLGSNLTKAKMDNANSIRIGEFYSDTLGYSHTGYIDEIRISDTVRHNVRAHDSGVNLQITPPSGSFSCDGSTLLLIQSDTTDGSTTFTDSCSALEPVNTTGIFDNKIKNVTITDYVDSNVLISEATNPFPGGTQSFYFPGGVDNGIQYDPIDDDDFDFGTDPFYMTMWVKFDGTPNSAGNTILGKWDTTSAAATGNNSFLIYMDSSGYVNVSVQFRAPASGPYTWTTYTDGRGTTMSSEGPEASRPFPGATRVNDNKWHHIAIDRGPTTDTEPGDHLRLFVDGLLLYWHPLIGTSNTYTSPTMETSNKDLMIGDFHESGGVDDQSPKEWKGWIDDVKIVKGDTIYKSFNPDQLTDPSIIRMVRWDKFNVPTGYSTNLTQWIDPNDTNTYKRPNWTFTTDTNVKFLVQANLNTVSTVSTSVTAAPVVGANTYPEGSKLYYLRSIDLPDVEEWGESFVAPMETRIGEVYYGHNVSLSGILDVENINDWQYFFSSFYSYTHGNEIRGSWQFDSNWFADVSATDMGGWTGGFNTYPHLTGAPNPEVSAGWGYLRYGGHDHRQYGKGWETEHIKQHMTDNRGAGHILAPSAIGF